MPTLPITESWEELDEVASNFDREWSSEIAKDLQLKPNAAFAQYSGWNFCGYVWFDGKEFQCQIWRYGVPVSQIASLTGTELMRLVSQRFGYE
jgi:hypothetical protein